MTEISEAAKMKANELFLSAPHLSNRNKIARFIQEVSDAAAAATGCLKSMTTSSLRNDAIEYLAPFILPEPVDPLVEAFAAIGCDPSLFANSLRAELAKRGFAITRIGDAS